MSDQRERELRAQQAKALLNNPILKDALQDMKTTAIQLWANSSDKEKRDGLWYEYRAATRLENLINAVINDAGGSK